MSRYIIIYYNRKGEANNGYFSHHWLWNKKMVLDYKNAFSRSVRHRLYKVHRRFRINNELQEIIWKSKYYEKAKMERIINNLNT